MVLVARELEVDGGIPEICAEDSDLSSSSSSPPILRGTLRAVVDFFMMVGLWLDCGWIVVGVFGGLAKHRKV